ncbi:OmpP1/FadL family transporter [bacterium]
MSTNRTSKIVMIVTLIILQGSLLANGLNLNSVGSKAIGMGGAFVGLADDYSAVFWNPAGITQIEGTSVSLYVTDVIPSATYKMPDYQIDAATKTNHYLSGALTVFFDAGSKLKVGFFGDVPAGLGAEWDGKELLPFSGMTGVEYEWLSKIGVIHFGPAIAYQVTDKLSVGATVNIAYGMMDMIRPVDMITAEGLPGEDHVMDAQYTEESTGTGFGINAGLLYKASEKLQFGAAVKSRVKVGFSGDAENLLMAGMGAPSKSEIERDITWPLWVAGGLAVKPMDKLTLTADVQWTQWSATEDVIITDYKDPAWKMALEQADAHKMNLHWDDQTQIRVGAQYQISDLLALRAGYYSDPAPGPDKTANILLPSISNDVITVGFGIEKGVIDLDFSFEYIMGSDREIAPSMENMPGIHGMNILVPNIALSYKFGGK